MQTLSPTITRKVNTKINQGVTDTKVDLLPAIAHSSVLQTALSGLEASLNDELDRYRHWQANGQTISYLNPFKPRVISTQSVWASPSMSEALLPPLEPPVDNRAQRTIQMPVMPPLAKISTEMTADQVLGKLDNSQHSSDFDRGIGTDIDNAFASNQTLSTYSNYAIASESNTGNSASTNFAARAENTEADEDEILHNFADDYASHYQNSMEIPSAPFEKSTFHSLMNPVGIISLLLLLCSSAAIGYLLVDPSGIMKFFKSDSRPKAAQTDSKSNELAKNVDLQSQQQTANDSSLSFAPFAGGKSPANQTLDRLKKNGDRLNPAIAKKNSPSTSFINSSNSFVPNNNSSSNSSSSTSRTVPSTNFSSTAISPLPSALAPSSSSTLEGTTSEANAPEKIYETPVATSYSTRSSSRSSTNALRSTATARSSYTEPTNTYSDYVAPRKNNSVKYAAPLSASPVDTTVAPTNNGGYRVVIENGYGANAKQIERDAYVRPSDGQVQVGSYSDPNAAQQRIEQLRRQGIPAKIQ